MPKNEIKYRAELKKKAGRLLNYNPDGFGKLTQEKQGELQEVLLELIGLDIKVTGPDPNINTQVSRIRKKKKTSKNQQLILIF